MGTKELVMQPWKLFWSSMDMKLLQRSISEKRWAAFGQTDAGRLLTIIFKKREKLLRVISARDMNRKEKKFYEKSG